MSSSPMPPGTSFSRRVFAFRYATIGSAASTRGLVVIVSQAVMPTFAALMPVVAQRPSLRSTFGLAV